MPSTTITCVRHAQGFHNLTTANHTMRDPLLTPLGKEQCATLAAQFPPTPKITHIVASPLRRTIYTALLSFPTAIAQGIQIIALPEIQEASDLPCDTGSSVALLEEEFGAQVDLRLVREGWNDKKGKWSPAASAIEKRAAEARAWLYKLGKEEGERTGQDVHIAVVTHGGFLHYFTEDWDECEKFVGTGWANTEFRVYGFGKGEALVEEEASRERRGVRPLSESEQRNLKESAEREWQESGFQTPKDMEAGELVEQVAVGA